MAVNKVVYDGNTLIDLTNDTVTPDTLVKGMTAHDAAGNSITGTYDGVTRTELADELNTLQQTIPTKTSDITNDSGFVNETFVNQKVADLVNSAPETLDTLGEVAQAIQDNETVVEALNSAIGNKVDKVEGKSLSTNDYTNEEKEKLNEIEVGANKTVVDDILNDTSTNPIQNKIITKNINKINKDIEGKADKTELFDKDYNSLNNKPTIPTKTSELNNDSGFVNEAFVNQKVADLVNSAPETLDTLGEVAQALQENENVVDALNKAIGDKADKSSLNNYLPLAGGTMTGALELSGDPTTNMQASTKQYVDNEIDNIHIGGRNLVAGTDGTTEFSGAAAAEGLTKDVWTGTTIAPPMGTEYVASFDAKADVAMDINCYFYSPNTTLTSETSTGEKRTGNIDGSSKVSVTTEWKRYWVKWTQTPTNAVKTLLIGRNSSTSNIYIRTVKLEEGNMPTAWTPAPEDIALASDVNALEARLAALENSVVAVLSGTTEPTSDIGEDGDIYLVTE